jgi:drug/metabolite transporter (DMT)-like permease
MTPQPHRPTDVAALGVLCRVLAMACLAALYATVRWASRHGVPVFEIVFFRSAFALVPILGFILVRRDPTLLKTQRPVGHLVRAAIGLTSMVCVFAALKYLPLTEATAFGFAAPLFMTVLAALVLREPVGLTRAGALVVGFAGVLIMLHPQAGAVNWKGASLALLAAASSAGAMVAIRQMGSTERSSTIALYFTLAGVALGLAGSIGRWVAPDPQTLSFLILGGLIGGTAQLLLTHAVTLAPVSVVAPFDYTQLLWALMFGVLLWGEVPSLLTVAGAGTVAASGLYLMYREAPRAGQLLPRRRGSEVQRGS